MVKFCYFSFSFCWLFCDVCGGEAKVEMKKLAGARWQVAARLLFLDFIFSSYWKFMHGMEYKYLYIFDN